jgi:hypothetical protein
VGVLAAGATLAASALVFGGAATSLPASAATGAPVGDPKKTHDCITPDGTNLNKLYGVKERIIGPPTCREAFAGERWVRSVPDWITAAGSSGAVYPTGYTPAKPNPIDDFNSKFVGATYVHDRGTPQEKTFTFGREVLRTGFFTPEGLNMLGRVGPKPVSSCFCGFVAALGEGQDRTWPAGRMPAITDGFPSKVY